MTEMLTHVTVTLPLIAGGVFFMFLVLGFLITCFVAYKAFDSWLRADLDETLNTIGGKAHADEETTSKKL